LGALLCPRHDPCVCGNPDICGLGNICTHYKSEDFENLPMFRPPGSEPVTRTYESESALAPVPEPVPEPSPESDETVPEPDHVSDPDSDSECYDPEPQESSDEDPFGDVPERY